MFAVTDMLALGVMDAARSAGLAVPDQLSVVGFDDIAEAAAYDPALTTVAQPLFEKGRVAARLVLAKVAGRAARPPRMGTHLVVRGSTGPPPAPRSHPPDRRRAAGVLCSADAGAAGRGQGLAVERRGCQMPTNP